MYKSCKTAAVFFVYNGTYSMTERQTKNLTNSFTFTTLAIYFEALTAAKFNDSLWGRQLQTFLLINFS